MPRRRKYRRIYITNSRQSFNRRFSMLMDILKRPSLGEHVRHIEYNVDCCTWTPNPQQPRRELSGEELQLLRAAVRKAGFVGDEERLRVLDLLLELINLDVAKYATRRDLVVGGPYMAQALTTLLISVSPFLSSIAIAQSFHHFHERAGRLGPEIVGFPLYQFLHRTNNNADPHEFLFLQHLRSVYVINVVKDYMDDGQYYKFMDFTGALALFHRLPSIESVGVDILMELEGVPVEEITRSNFSKIAIRHSALNSIYLASLICSCKVLREFEYSIGGRSEHPRARSSVINAKTFIQALLMHKETLELLDVDAGSDMDCLIYHEEGPDEAVYALSGPPPDEMWEQHGSLRDFHSLKHLSVGVDFLMYFARGVVNPAKKGDFSLVDCLPENLESLCIRGYERGKRKNKDNDNDIQLDALIAWQKRGTSKLKTIRGIYELIPNAEHVEDPDDDEHLLWQREEEEWSEEE